MTDESNAAQLPTGLEKSHIIGMIAARISLGVFAIVAPRTMARLLFFPRDHVTASAVLLGRFYGVRNIVFGLMTIAAVGDHDRFRKIVAVNAAVDAADAAMIIVPLARRDGIDATAISALGIASLLTLGWLRIFFRSSAR